jgi:hypothetical protein
LHLTKAETQISDKLAILQQIHGHYEILAGSAFSRDRPNLRFGGMQHAGFRGVRSSTDRATTDLDFVCDRTSDLSGDKRCGNAGRGGNDKFVEGSDQLDGELRQQRLMRLI